MPVKLNVGAKILFDTISKNLRHQDYNRVKKVAEDYTIYATGYGIESKLRRFNGRETEDAFAQRLALTQCNVPDIFNSCVKPLYKVGRTPASITVNWEGADASKNAEQRKALFDIAKNFWGKKDVSKYITQRQADLDSTDPNSFIIVEFKEDVNPADPKTKANPYPFEANSAEAINYVYNNNELEWLVVLNYLIILDGKGKELQGEQYYMYIDNETISATQIHKDLLPQAQAAGAVMLEEFNEQTVLQPKTQYIFSTDEKTESKKRFFIIQVFQHNIGFVPARRFGSILDPLTRNRTCIPLVFAAQCYFEKSIKTMSEFDLTNCLHVFPQKIQYSDPCPGEPTNSGWIGCDKGMRPDGNTICKACGGSGFKVHTSAQDIIQIRMPKDLTEIVSLENILVYKHPPIDLLEFQKKFGFYELRQAAQSAVYNSDVFTRQEIATTATEKSIDLDAVYDTLMPYADTWSELYVFIYRAIAALRDLDKGLKITHEFPKDFKMQSFAMLLDDLQKATASGAPSHVKKSIVKDINRKIYAAQPNELMKFDVKDKYFPFPGKSESEINFIIANNATTEYLKALWAHFDFIFSELEFEQNKNNVDFYQMEEQAQRTLIEKKVNELLVKIEEDASKAAALAFSATDPGNDTGNEGGAQ